MSEQLNGLIELAMDNPEKAFEELRAIGGPEVLNSEELAKLINLQKDDNKNIRKFVIKAVEEYYFPRQHLSSLKDKNENSDWKRPNWDEIFMFHAIAAASRHTCLKRGVGAVLVKDKRVIASGYNGAPAGIKSCLEYGYCYYDSLAAAEAKAGGKDFNLIRNDFKIYCQAVHAEINTFAQVTRDQAKGASLYITNYSCPGCTQGGIITNCIKEVFIWKQYLQNPLLTIDEKRVSESKLLQAGVAVNYLNLTPKRIMEIAQYMSIHVGERTNYIFTS